MSSNDFVYTGQENLEAMRYAKNYNDYLVKIVEKQISSINRPNIQILDFGAGLGTYADLLKEKGYKVDCLEMDQDQIRQLKQKGYEVYDGIEALPEYDLIYSFNVFEHIEDDIKVYNDLSKKLKASGRMVTYVPAFEALFSSMDRLVEHQRRYRFERLRVMNDKVDMKIVTLKYCDPLGFLAALLFKYAGNNNGTITPSSVRLYDRVAFLPSRLLEPVTSRLFGKNALLIAERP